MRLIDADELDRAFTKARWYHDGGMHHWGDRSNWCLRGEEVERLITEAPTIDAEPVKRGKWLITPYTDYDDTYECSVCGNGWTFIEGTPKENDANYCPNCGAKMEV